MPSTTASFRSQHTIKTSTLPRKPKNNQLPHPSSFDDLKHAQSHLNLSNIPGITRQQQQQLLSICNNLNNNNHSFVLCAPPNNKSGTMDPTTAAQFMSTSNATTPKSNIFTRTLKKTTMRAKERVMAQFTRQHDRTSDEQFDELAMKISQQHQLALRFAKELRCYALGVKALACAGKSLNEVICGTGNGTGGNVLDDIVWPKGDKQFTATTYAMETHWSEYSDALNNALLQSVQTYLDQFPDLQARIAKRHRKLLDFDGARHELNALESAKKPDESKINRAYEQLNAAKNAYEDLNEELRQILPRIREARILFYSKTLRDFSDIERKFHTKLVGCYTDMLPALNRLVEDVHTGQYGISHPTLPRRTSAPEVKTAEEKPQVTSNSFYPNIDPYEHDFDSHDEDLAERDMHDRNVSDDNMTVTDDTLRNSDGDVDSYMSDTCTNSTQANTTSRKQMKRIVSRTRIGGAALTKALREKASDLLSSASSAKSGSKKMTKSKSVVALSSKEDSGNNSSEIEDEAGRPRSGETNIVQQNGSVRRTSAVERENSIEFKGLRRLADDECSLTLTTPTFSSSSSENSHRRHSQVVRAAPPPPPLPVPPELPVKKSIHRKRSFVRGDKSTANSIKSAATAPAASGTLRAPPAPPMPEHWKKASSTISYKNKTSTLPPSSSGDHKPTTASEMFVSLVEQLKNRKLMYRVQATHAHKADKGDELSFEKGDLIYVVEPNGDEKQDPGWQMGIKAATGQMGLFPESFTRVLLGSAA